NKERAPMKQFLSKPAVLIVLVATMLGLPVVTVAQNAPSLEVAVAAICQDVVDREPVDAGVSFSASVGTLYCFTKITGAQNPTKITHVWYFGGTERARVELDINSDNWRTWSSKIIQANEIGSWRVDILDEAGTVLKELQFEITQ
ncbi:MAG: DUF2914 domain-containing protein, partial [Deltaproteobacteria bacterium]|nr:DUF2914 domain-containing protein [Deltaproteobacteria bacterium]